MEITISEIQLFQILKQKLGEKEAEALVTFVEEKVKQGNEQNIKILATKEDISRLEVKINDVKVDIIKWVFAFFITMMLTMLGLYFKH